MGIYHTLFCFKCPKRTKKLILPIFCQVFVVAGDEEILQGNINTLNFLIF